mgnify:CR=1 FL=1
MSDLDLDRELRQAIKAGVDRSLEGWTFTPAMRQAVLERIEAEGEPAATPETPRRQSLKPVYWVAAAAAALILAVNLLPERPKDFSGGGAPEASSMASTETGEPSKAPRLLAQPGNAAPLNMSAPEIEDESDDPGVPGGSDALTMAMAPAAPVKLTLRIEELGGEAAEDEVTRSGELMLMAVKPKMLDIAVLPDGNVALLSSSSLRVVDRAGNVVAEEPLVQEPTALAYGSGAEPAVVSGNVVERFRADGQPAGSLELDGTPALVAVVADRTAVADESGVKVYAGEEQVLSLDGLRAEAIALADDGALAVLTGTPEPRLQVYAATGALMMEQAAEPDGSALAFLNGGTEVAAGSEVYDRSGILLWSFPFVPEHVANVGSGDLVLAWNAQSAALIRAGTGEPLWLAEAGSGTIVRAAAALDSDLAAVVVADETGAGVWVMDGTGAWRHAERLDEVPVDVAVTGGHLHILSADGLEVRSLSDEGAP